MFLEQSYKVKFISFFKGSFSDMELETLITKFKYPGLSKVLEPMLIENDNLNALVFLLTAFYNYLYRLAPYVVDMNLKSMEVKEVVHYESFTEVKVLYEYE